MVKGIPLALGFCFLAGVFEALSNSQHGSIPLILALGYLSSLFVKPIEQGEVHFVRLILALPLGWVAFQWGQALGISLFRLLAR